MILQIPAYGIQFYVRSVKHDFDLGSNGSGFSTSISTMAPSTIGNSGPPGFPRGGAWIGYDNPGPSSGGDDVEGGNTITDSIRGVFW